MMAESKPCMKDSDPMVQESGAVVSKYFFYGSHKVVWWSVRAVYVCEVLLEAD